MAVASPQDFTPEFIGYVRRGDVESAKKFLSIHEIDLNQSSSETELTPLMLACKQGHLEMIKLLIAKGADMNFLTRSCKSTLIIAVEKRKLDVVRLLIHRGAHHREWGGVCSNHCM